ncbi:hypothetical protein D9599_10090 [Roseomonas sp. KE2513]|uniref:hypothetical protein n=1 Tax=Roseomonas sp. KE2513 TaxID=2479202 RepID=UPI0018DF106C|nr:hypothetical protein [Roseomonas sp. KE2513]MBI0535921.1 hypothetical protein [Roseomonas sp. KE2513]
MRKIFTVVALTGVLMGGAMPAQADGNDATGGQTRVQSWKQPAGPAPRADTAAVKFIGGEDQYLVAPTRSPTWSQPADKLTWPMQGRRDAGPALSDFFANQSG